MPLNQKGLLQFQIIDMLQYFIKRILLFVPTIIFIGAFTFFLFHASPADPVESLLRTEGFENKIMSEDQYRIQYKRLAKELDLDKPKFYFSIVPSYYPDTMHNIIDLQDRKRLTELLAYHNDWSTVNSFLREAKNLVSDPKYKSSTSFITELLYVTDPKDFKSVSAQMTKSGSSYEELAFLGQVQELKQKKRAFAFPKLLWFGTKNQFHAWMSNFFTGSLGRSIHDGKPVWSKISKALIWTLFLVIISLSSAVLISVLFGVLSASYNTSNWIKGLIDLFYFIYAMPLFWFSTLMVVFFTTAQYGNWTNIFPGVGISPYSGDLSTLGRITSNSKQLILPIFCIVLNSIAYLSSIVRNSLIAESKQAYKTTALLKGLTRKATFWKHLFPNAILPLVTIIIGAIPTSLAGSLVIEVIFNIPGIGRLMFDSIFGNDWYVIFSIVMMVGVVTIVSYLIGDLLYSYLNPRIRFGPSQKV